MTPLQVLSAAWKNEEGFNFASAAEPYRSIDADMTDWELSEAQVAELYTPEVLRVVGGPRAVRTPRRHCSPAWHILRPSQPNGNQARRKSRPRTSAAAD